MPTFAKILSQGFKMIFDDSSILCFRTPGNLEFELPKQQLEPTLELIVPFPVLPCLKVLMMAKDESITIYLMFPTDAILILKEKT